MKLRHLRAVAVVGALVVALTGARGSHGGGCDDSSSSSSSSSHRDSDDDDLDDHGSASGGSVPGGGGNTAMRYVDIAECGLDPAGENMTATVTVDNTAGSVDYEYDITVAFTTASGSSVGTATATDFPVAAGETGETGVSTPYTGTGDGSEVTECEVRTARRAVV